MILADRSKLLTRPLRGVVEPHWPLQRKPATSPRRFLAAECLPLAFSVVTWIYYVIHVGAQEILYSS